MRIQYITSVLGCYGGSEIYTRDLLTELMKRGHELLVCTTEKYDLAGAEMLHFPVFGHHALFKFEAPFFYRRAVKAAKRFKPDIIQSHSNSCMGWIGDRCKNATKKPHVLLIELITHKNKNIHTKAIYSMEKFMLPKLKYDKLVVWTENIKQRYLLPWRISEDRIEVIPAAINTSNYNFKENGKPIREKYGRNLIVSIKSLWGTNAKGLEYVIKAMKYVNERHPDWVYCIFGPGEERPRLIDFTKRLGLEHCVKIPGALSEPMKRHAWAATEIAPHSFVYEFSTSVSLLEYMAVGKANIVTDIGSVRDFVADAAMVVEAQNPKSIARGINSLIENPKLRKELGRKAKKLVEEKYSIKATVDRLEEIYEKLSRK